MAGDNECDQRSGNTGTAKASPLSRFFGSDAFLFIVMLVLGTLTFGWVFYSPLGSLWGILNGTIIIGIIIAGMGQWLVEQPEMTKKSKADKLHKGILNLLDTNGQMRSLRDLERDIYNFAWHHHRYNSSAIAKSLQIARSRWYRILQKFKFDE